MFVGQPTVEAAKDASGRLPCHNRDMTRDADNEQYSPEETARRSDELLKHLFHPKVVKHVKKHVAKLNKSTMKRG